MNLLQEINEFVTGDKWYVCSHGYFSDPFLILTSSGGESANCGGAASASVGKIVVLDS